mgnify:CR=1 FL=1
MLASVLAFASSAEATTYYVDGSNPSCTDSGDGSSSSPYCTISAAVTARAGHVWLVGAGPGAPGLVTVAGLEALRRADVVLYDRLAPAELLAEAPAGALLPCAPGSGAVAATVSTYEPAGAGVQAMAPVDEA